MRTVYFCILCFASFGVGLKAQDRAIALTLKDAICERNEAIRCVLNSI